MRSASAQLTAALASESTSLARLWRVTRTDGTELFFTDAVTEVVFNGDTYRSDISFTSSAIFTSRSAVNQQSVNMSICTDDTAFDEGDIRLGLYISARAAISVIDYKHPEWGELILFEGIFGQVVLSDQHVASIEIIPDAALGNENVIGLEKYSATCRANLGDARCKFNIDAQKVAFTVVSASGASLVASEFTQAANHWVLGRIDWLTGANAGTSSTVQSGDPNTTSVFLLSAPLNAIAAGDTGNIYLGCDKQLQTCLSKFNNVVNFRGEPHVPNGMLTIRG